MRLLLGVILLFNLGAVEGISQDQSAESRIVRLGQSAAFSGPASELGKKMRLGIEAALTESVLVGGIGGKQVFLTYLDDGYEPGRTVANIRTLIDEKTVFALLGAVGTPTSRAAAPIARDSGVPFIAPFTGAALLRDTEGFPNVVNFRASYQQETDEMVDRLVKERGFTRFGLLYQDDSFGRAGLHALQAATARYGLKLVGSGIYERNTVAVKTAVLDLMRAEPEAVVIFGAYRPAAAAITWSHELGFKPVFVNISFVGSQDLARELRPGISDVFVTQVVPDYMSEEFEIARQFRSALEAVWPGSKPDYISFEGYVGARMLLAAMQNCADTLTRECVLDRFKSKEPMELGGMVLNFGPDDNQGSDAVFLTEFDGAGQFSQVASFTDGRH
ncbi:MAG: ABC transporter substrate-binding protein [Rhodobacteraceae bacterium]|nr:ABC transporter substrate-binding protein [Paracoccaceae bacterium]